MKASLIIAALAVLVIFSSCTSYRYAGRPTPRYGNPYPVERHGNNQRIYGDAHNARPIYGDAHNTRPVHGRKARRHH